MKKLLILMCIISLMGCSTSKKLRSPKGQWTCELQPLGTYDTSCVIKDNFWRGTTTIVYMDDDSCVVIWGKKCDFQKNDSLFAKAVWWAGADLGGGGWRYYLVNKDESLKYPLL